MEFLYSMDDLHKKNDVFIDRTNSSLTIYWQDEFWKSHVLFYGEIY